MLTKQALIRGGGMIMDRGIKHIQYFIPHGRLGIWIFWCCGCSAIGTLRHWDISAWEYFDTVESVSLRFWHRDITALGHFGTRIFWDHAQQHGLRTPNEGRNQRYLKSWANVADKICFGCRDHPFKTSACHCLRGEGVSPCANGQKVTVHKDQKSPSYAFCWNADGRGIGVRNRENLPTS